jgi:hypothetical protein
MTPLTLKNSSSNSNYLNFNGTAKEIDNQVLTPVIGNTSDVYKNFIVIESPLIVTNDISTENIIIINS